MLMRDSQNGIVTQLPVDIFQLQIIRRIECEVSDIIQIIIFVDCRYDSDLCEEVSGGMYLGRSSCRYPYVALALPAQKRIGVISTKQ